VNKAIFQKGNNPAPWWCVDAGIFGGFTEYFLRTPSAGA